MAARSRSVSVAGYEGGLRENLEEELHTTFGNCNDIAMDEGAVNHVMLCAIVSRRRRNDCCIRDQCEYAVGLAKLPDNLRLMSQSRSSDRLELLVNWALPA